MFLSEPAVQQPCSQRRCLPPRRHPTRWTSLAGTMNTNAESCRVDASMLSWRYLAIMSPASRCCCCCWYMLLPLHPAGASWTQSRRL